MWKVNLAGTILSIVFAKQLVKATGRYELGLELGFPLFFTGIIRAWRHPAGTDPSRQDWLKRASRQWRASPLICLIMSLATSSGPAALLRFSLLIAFINSDIEISPHRPTLLHPHSEWRSLRAALLISLSSLDLGTLDTSAYVWTNRSAFSLSVRALWPPSLSRAMAAFS